jgi:hypothetical protein
MHSTTRELTIGQCGVRRLSGGSEKSSTVISVLRALLCQTIELRDLYKCARRHEREGTTYQTPQLFDAHYREQLRLVDVLIDRVRTLGGEPIFAADVMHCTELPSAVRGRSCQRGVLDALLDAHESIGHAVNPGGTDDERETREWMRDFAVGQVVLANHLQMQSVENLLAAWSDIPRFSSRIADMED